MRTDEDLDTRAQVNLRTVSELCHIPPETLGKCHHLPGYADTHRCCGKSLMESALVGFDVRQHARRESISKRAPSTTRTSLRFLESTICEQPETVYRKTLPQFVLFHDVICIQRFADTPKPSNAKIV